MARLHVDIDDLRDDLDMALGLLRRGGQVLIEREGRVVAELALPGARRAADGPEEGGHEHAVPVADLFADPGALPSALSILQAQGGVAFPNELWDELSREEALLEMLGSELE